MELQLKSGSFHDMTSDNRRLSCYTVFLRQPKTIVFYNMGFVHLSLYRSNVLTGNRFSVAVFCQSLIMLVTS